MHEIALQMEKKIYPLSKNDASFPMYANESRTTERKNKTGSSSTLFVPN